MSSDDISSKFMIKICGITSLDDAVCSIEYGATALGFNFYRKSPRYVDPEEVEKILEKISDHVLTVAVVVVSLADAPGTIEAISDRVPSIGAFQLHGLHSESEIPSADKRLYVATSPTEADAFPNHEIFIDTSWGKGKRVNWEQLRHLKRPFILSGGLEPENVAEAIELLQPAGVDVCSGVERSPGIKDARKLRRFVERARRAADS